MQDSSPTPSKAALVLSGGGARGAYQVGVLSALAEALPGPLPFDVVTGVSVGALNAAVIAEGAHDFAAAADKLEGIWRSLRTSSVFETRPWRLYGRLLQGSAGMAVRWAGIEPPASLFDASPLARLLTERIDFDRIGWNIDEGYLHGFAVTASSYGTSEAVTFYRSDANGADPPTEWGRARRRGVCTEVGADHILASAALPGLFEARLIDGHWYGDGALRQNAPLSPAIHLGADRLFLIAARDALGPGEGKEEGNEPPYPTLGFLGGQLLDIVFNDHLDADLERLHRINATLDSMLPERRRHTDLRPVDTHMVRPSEDIRTIAARHTGEIPRSVRTLLGMIGGLGPPYVLPSYLAFEPGFIGALIDLGRRDAEEDMDALKTYLFGSDQQPRKAPHPSDPLDGR